MVNRLVSVLVAVVTLTCFAPRASAEEKTPLVIEENTQATLEDVKLAAYNFRDETFVDETGAKKTGRTCALRVFVRGDGSKDQKLRVHAGQTFTANGKTFEVLGVESAQVRLRAK